MSIILKGIDMPKEKDEALLLLILGDGTVAEKIGSDRYEEMANTKAIQIPTPHGDIKDINTFLKNKCLTEYIENDVFNKKYTYAINTGAIYNAPTILEAEEDI